MSSTHTSATTRLPPPVIPLEQLPSASIVQLPPSSSFTKIARLSTSCASAATISASTTTTTTTTTAVTNHSQQTTPLIDTSSSLSFSVALQQPETMDTTTQQINLSGHSVPNISYSETFWHNNNLNHNYNLSSSSSLSSIHSKSRVGNRHESTIPFSTITTTNGMEQSIKPATLEQSSTTLSEKKLRRLEKNRLSARECRRRKREATQDMEQEICRLEGENLKLRLQLRVR
jgi:hypothetical protein